MIRQFLLDPKIAHLNHGSFGATPKVIHEERIHWEREMELSPTAFYLRRLPDLLNESREHLAKAFSSSSNKIAFVGNATSGISQIARGISISEGSTVLTTSLGYGAANRAWEFAAKRRHANYRCLEIPFPYSQERFLQTLREAVSENLSVVCLDHIASASALVLPIQKACTLIRELAPGAKIVIDGAHGPGMANLELESYGADFYVGNLHKWFCAPKACAFLWGAGGAEDLDPLVVSWGWQAEDDFPFGSVHDWKGTEAFGQILSIPRVLRFHNEIGWADQAKRCRELAQQFRTRYHESTGLETLCSAEDIYQMTPIPYPTSESAAQVRSRFLDEHGVQFNAAAVSEKMAVRASFHLYNTEEDLEHGLKALAQSRSRRPAG